MAAARLLRSCPHTGRVGLASRWATAYGPIRHVSTAASAPPLVESSLSSTGVLTLTFNNPDKLNAWTLPLLRQLFFQLQDATPNPAVKGVVLTGKGKYYSAGVDLSAIIKPMAPTKLIRQIRDQNQRLFASILEFPKPIAAAVNGPAIGAAVTSTLLVDGCFASPSATFSLPFARLGVPPEGEPPPPPQPSPSAVLRHRQAILTPGLPLGYPLPPIARLPAPCPSVQPKVDPVSPSPPLAASPHPAFRPATLSIPCPPILSPPCLKVGPV
jgi:hypothetical protein